MPTHLILRTAACISVAFLIGGCSSSDARAREALSAYQSAAASNDMIGARRALLELVRAKDDVPDYWVELGKLQTSMGNFGDAYYAFTRAYELDRSNVDILRAVTELALRSGDISLARSHAQDLEILSPGDPWVKLTNGWAAYNESHFDQAIAAADSSLAASPYDPGAIILKARSLMSLHREGEATDLLTKQVKAQPSDMSSLQLLARIYVRDADWTKVVPVANQIVGLNPMDRENALLLIQAAFRSGNVAAGRQASLRLLNRPNVDRALILSVLGLWTDYWPSSQRMTDAKTLANASPPQQRLVYAAFVGRLGDSADEMRLANRDAALPVSAATAEANAVLADGLSRSGNFAAAKNRFDAVLAFDPGNATALRGRAELAIRTGNARAAVEDAQKLVTLLPNSAADRLLLARSYAAAGDRAWVDRTLWTAFEAIPADEKIYAALEASRKGDPEATRNLREEFDRQRDAKSNRGLL